MADEKTTPNEAAPTQNAPASVAEAKAAKSPPKKEKPPALEDKAFTEFMEQNFLPTLATALQEKGIEDIQLTFDQRPLAVFGVRDPESYWQVKGQWQRGDGEASLSGNRQFNIAFTKDDIASPKLFYFADKGSEPSTLEQFMGDERKITLDLMVLYTLGRLNGQKWLERN